MRYHVLAADYDGTLAHHGRVSESTMAALRLLRESGRKLVLVTGRLMSDLLEIFPEGLELCERVVAENGGVIYDPATKQTRALVEPPPPAFARKLSEAIGGSVQVGKVIVATWTPHEIAAVELINQMGLEMQVIFNKGAVMILPSGVNKASGLRAALEELGLSPRNTVGVGDAENDHAFISICECGVAVQNALQALKDRADLVTDGDHGTGVEQLIDKMVKEDLASVDQRVTRHRLTLGHRLDGQALTLSAYRKAILFAGSSGGGKSTLATALIEDVVEKGYQCCILDPEGDFQELPNTVALGDAQHAPPPQEVLEVLNRPGQNLVVSMVGVPLADRPAYFEALLPRLFELRARTGRPHWIVLDEVHHLALANRAPSSLALPKLPHNLLMITVHPEHVSPALIREVDAVVGIGQLAESVITEVARIQKLKPLEFPGQAPASGQAMVWLRDGHEPPFLINNASPKAERRRHIRKYATGELDPDRSFFFRGPKQKLNLRAQNLDLFLQMADGVDDETWLFHLREGDYSRWFRDNIKDTELARDAEAVEREESLSPRESRQRIRAAIESRYTAAA
jgi:hydroxymethylpyrimidine pyrophosphatase-like HAD family hydrolase